MVAPWDGIATVGVAYGADLVSVRIADDVVNFGIFNEVEALLGIYQAVFDHDARIVAMAWGTVFDLNTLGDMMRSIWVAKDVLFVGAAGTAPGCLFNYGVTFPGRMSIVVAAAGLNWNNEPSEQSCWGPEVDLGAVIGQVPSLGYVASDEALIGFGGSSNATALISSIAALVWSEYPTWNRDQVRERLYATAAWGIAGKTGHGRVDAYRAVGGFHASYISGPSSVAAGATYTLSAVTLGDGPFRYRWSNGSTARTITATSGAPGSSVSYSVVVTDLRENKSITSYRTVSVPAPVPEDPPDDPCYSSTSESLQSITYALPRCEW